MSTQPCCKEMWISQNRNRGFFLLFTNKDSGNSTHTTVAVKLNKNGKLGRLEFLTGETMVL